MKIDFTETLKISTFKNYQKLLKYASYAVETRQLLCLWRLEAKHDLAIPCRWSSTIFLGNHYAFI